MLERATHASDLWNLLSYRFFFTLFSPVQSPALPFWVPRKQLADDAWAFTFDRQQLTRDQMRQLSILREAYVDKVESSGNGEFELSTAARENFATIEKAFPDRSLRARTLLLVTPRNPHLTRELDPTEKQSYEASLRKWSETLDDAGFEVFPLGIDYESEDFIDAHHFSNRGGTKNGGRCGRPSSQDGRKEWLDEPGVAMKPNTQTMLRSALSVFVGLFVGILFSYLVYRLSLPVEPFVYVAF